MPQKPSSGFDPEAVQYLGEGSLWWLRGDVAGQNTPYGYTIKLVGITENSVT